MRPLHRYLAAACLLVLLVAYVGSPQPTTLVPTETFHPAGTAAPAAPASPTSVPTIMPEVRVSSPGAYLGYSPELYTYGDWVKTSQYVTVRDGTKLAIDIYRPAQRGQPVSIPLPVIWTHTRYHRERVPQLWLGQMLAYGYVVAAVDVRGAGASYGTFQSPFSQQEAQDAYDITEWLAVQPWSNGNIGMYGASYLGITQYMAASTAPPHLKAVVPEKAVFDLYSFTYPGGVFRDDFFAQWTAQVKELDASGAPVDQATFDIQEGMYENLELLDIYNKNEYQITEGQVHVLYVSHGHDGGDSIIINGVNFRVGLNTTVGYKTLIAEGGVLREGMDVRVFHYNGKILRVDTKIPNTNSLWNPSLPKAVVG